MAGGLKLVRYMARAGFWCCCVGSVLLRNCVRAECREEGLLVWVLLMVLSLRAVVRAGLGMGVLVIAWSMGRRACYMASSLTRVSTGVATSLDRVCCAVS